MYGQRPPMQFGPRITPMVRAIVLTTAAVFVWQLLGSLTSGGATVLQVFGLTPVLFVGSLYFWQPITYLFLHGGFWHLLFNMFALWMFGSELEHHWGRQAFLKFYLVTGVGAGIVSVLFHPFSPIPTIGASGAIYGILMAYGMMFPNRYVLIYFLFPVKVKYFVAIFGALAFFSAFGTSGSPVDNFAHLGGMLFGFLYLKGWVSVGRIRQSYYRWRLKRMRGRFDVYEGGRKRESRRKPEDDYWIN